VAGRAQARVGACFIRVPRSKARAVQALQADVVERHLPRQRGHGADAMARRARSLAVAGRAEIALAPGPHAVLADPIAVVNEVTRGRGVLRREVDVTGVAAAQVPFILVLVTAEADGHLREQRLGPRLRDRAVAANAVSVDDRIVLGVVEAHVLAGERGLLAHRRFAVASAARPLVVRFCVTAATVGVGGKVHGTRRARVLHARVAFGAGDPLVHVRAVLERVRPLGGAKPEHARARGERQDERHRERER
jgi:hypothetical protein